MSPDREEFTSLGTLAPVQMLKTSAMPPEVFELLIAATMKIAAINHADQQHHDS
jgi:hypothetical protein